MEVKELTFKKVPGNDAKSFPCNYCGTVGFTYHWWQAVVRFMKGAEFKIVLCSDKCKEDFINNPRSQAFLDESILELARFHRDKNKLIVPPSDHGHN